MGHYCRICGCARPNEAFSGGGHKTHVCRECKRLPKKERDAIEQQDAIYGFMEQSHISTKNVDSLKVLAASDNMTTAHLAQLVLEVAKVKPHKRRRFKILADKCPDLLERLEEAGLVQDPEW
jgi:hypothetical protein